MTKVGMVCIPFSEEAFISSILANMDSAGCCVWMVSLPYLCIHDAYLYT